MKIILFFVFWFACACAEPVYPKPLKPGDTIAIVATSSFPEEDQQTIEKGLKLLEKKGYKIKIASNLYSKHGYLAGTDAERAKALMNAWRDQEVKAIWCYRGGFGSPRILHLLDYEAIKENPKIFIGMSDITALHAAIQKETGLVTFLGPNVVNVTGTKEKPWNTFNEEELFRHITTEKRATGVYPTRGKELTPWTLRPGKAKGLLVGGNLTLIVSLIGTPWQIDTQGKILVIEDVDEEPYRIDRLLCQMKHAGLLDKPAGVILSSFKGCKSKKPLKSLSLEKVFQDYFWAAPYPVLVGFSSGHLNDQVTLPLNSLAELNASNKTLTLLE